MTLATVRAAAIDRALVGDDPESALALAGVVDSAIRRRTDEEPTDTDGPRNPAESATDPFTAAMLAIGCVGAASPLVATHALDERAWRPGRDAESAVVAGAAVAVRNRDVAVDRAADLASCTPATLDAVVERQRREKRDRVAGR